MAISVFPSLRSLMPRSDPPHSTTIRTAGCTALNRSPIAAISGHIVLEPVIRSKPACGFPGLAAGSSARASTSRGAQQKEPGHDQTRPKEVQCTH